MTVLLPIRNGGARLSAALRSVVEQSYRNLEVICIDDGSTDGTRNELERIAESDGRIRVLETDADNRGLVPALQLGSRAAEGDFLARMDADDIAYPDRIKRQVELMERQPDIAVCGCQVAIEGPSKGEGFARYEKWINDLIAPDEIAAQRFVESPIVHPTALLRRGPFEAVGGYCDTEWAEDYDLWLRMIEAGQRITKVAEVLYQWTDHSARLTRTDERYSEQNFMRAKALYLSRIERVTRRGVMISGAGPTGKAMARLLRELGVEVHAFIDVAPRRIGTRVAGIEVIGIDAIPRAGLDVPIQLGAVGQIGRREKVAQLMREKGYREGTDFFSVA